MAGNYAINGTPSYATDPYFMWYLQNSYNPSFQSTSASSVSQKQEMPIATDVAVEKSQKEIEKEEKSTSYAGLWIAGTVGAAALIYGGRNSFSKPMVDKIKQLFGATKKVVQEKVGSQTSAATKFSAVMGKDGKLTYIIPNKTTTISGESEIRNFADKHGINVKDLMRFNKNSKLSEYKFVFEDGGIKNTVTVKDGAIVDINNGTKSIKEILDSAKAEDIKFVDKIQKQVSKIEQKENGWGKGLTDVKWSTQIGEDTLTIAKADLKKNTPASKIELNTLSRYTEDSDEVQAYLYNNPNIKKIFSSEALKNGKLPQGMKIDSYVYQYNKNTLCHYKNGEIAGITLDGKYYSKGTVVCDAFLNKESETLSKIMTKIFKDNEIPKDVSAVLVAA